MARSSTAKPAIEVKALAASSKSEGMRLLYDHGYSVAQVKKVFGCPYGFAYGVALRHGVIDTAAARRAPRTTKPVKRVAKARVSKTPAPKVSVTKVTPVAKVSKAIAAKATKPTTPARKSDSTSASARVAAKLAAAKVVGRPTPARRAANRKTRVATTTK